jgi:hypothetical protein
MQNSRTPWVFRLWGDHSHEITVDSNTESQFLRQCCGLSIQPDQRDSLVDFGADADNGHRTILQKRRQERGCRYRRLCVRSQCGIQLFCYRKTLAINHLRLGWVLSVRAHRGRNSFAMVQRRKKVRLALNSVPNQSGGSMRGFILFFLASVALPILGCGGSGITTNTPTPLTVRPNSLPPGAVGTAYSTTLSATGGKAPYTWSQTSGTFPSGLTLGTGTGTIAGTPTKEGASNSLVFQVKDANNATASSPSLSITVSQAVLAITPTSLGALSVGTPTNQSLTASPATTGPLTWTVQSGALPQGVALNNGTTSSSTSISTTSNSVALTGTPTITASYSFSLVVTDSETPNAGTSSITPKLCIDSAGLV